MNLKIKLVSIITLCVAACQNVQSEDTIIQKTTKAPVFEITTKTKDHTKTSSSNYKKTMIAGLEFSLNIKGQSCYIRSTTGEQVNVSLDSECNFHRNKKGEIQVENGHHGPVFLIISSTATESSPDCTTRIASVTVVDNKAYVAPALSTIATCLGEEDLDNIYFLAPRFEGLAYPDDK